LLKVRAARYVRRLFADILDARKVLPDRVIFRELGLRQPGQAMMTASNVVRSCTVPLASRPTSSRCRRDEFFFETGVAWKCR